MHRLRSRKPAASVCGRAAQISVLFTNSICQSYVILNTLSGRGEPVPCCVRSGLHFALDLWNSKSGVNILPRLSTHHAKKRLYSSPRHRTKQGQPWFERSQNIVQSNCLPLFFSLSCKHKVSFLVRQWEKTHICPYQYSLGILFIYFFLLQNWSSGLESHQRFIGIFSLEYDWEFMKNAHYLERCLLLWSRYQKYLHCNNRN